jgi:enoyl-CoA hydratase
MPSQLIVEVDGAVATLTLNRPEKRNALSVTMLGEIAEAITGLDADGTVRAMVLTGADPAFCAGVDLANFREVLGRGRGRASSSEPISSGLMPPHATPIVGAINGPAVTGGLELALGCDFLVASSRAAFADTHARVGVLPGGGLTVRLPALVGVDRARRMSLTGLFIDAPTALLWGLVTEVVAHEQLLVRASELARSIAEVDPVPLRALRQLYDEVAQHSPAAGAEHERRANRAWMADRFDDGALEERAGAIIERGSGQVGPGDAPGPSGPYR